MILSNVEWIRLGVSILSAVPIGLLVLPPTNIRTQEFIRLKSFPFLYGILSVISITAVLFTSKYADISQINIPLLCLGLFCSSQIPFLIHSFRRKEYLTYFDFRDLVMLCYCIVLYAIPISITLAISGLLSADLRKDNAISGQTGVFVWWCVFQPAVLSFICRRGLEPNYFGYVLSINKKSLMWFFACGIPAFLSSVIVKACFLHLKAIRSLSELLNEVLVVKFTFSAAFNEEFILRGTLFLLISLIVSKLRVSERKAAIYVIVFSSALFMLAHFEYFYLHGLSSIPFLLSIFIWGYCFGLLYYKTRNFFLCVILHTILNMLLGV